jgi:murein DD-endopeptidase MepM/ murein hydrolase activator NlpD
VVRCVPRGRTRQASIAVVMTLTASLLGAGFASPSLARPSADRDHHLQHQKNRIENRIENRKLDLDEISTALIRAKGRVDSAVVDLGAARTVLAGVREQVRQAEVYDQQMQEALAQAILRLGDARDDLAAGQQSVGEQRQALTEYAVTSYQSGETTALNLDIAFESATPEEALDQMQAATTVVDKQTVSVQNLEAQQVLLRLTEQRVEDTTDEVATRRTEAAESLQTKQGLEQQAEVAAEQVATRVQELRTSKQQIQTAKQRENERLGKLNKERDRVETMLRKIAEARERRAQLREQRAQARADRRERLARIAAKREHREHRAPPPPAVVSKSSSSTSSDSGAFLEYPVHNTYITSPYGMRMHPILHVYKLHDGTDFHADCGSPVYAAAPGRILSEYYNSGYGNRIIIDHGYVRGVSLSTSYNHMTSFVAGPGQYVRRGQLLGYSGTTGYSTGCHMHFMVYVNGYTVDPLRWL